MACLFISEAIYSWQSAVSGTSEQMLGFADVTNLCGGLFIVMMMAVLAGLDLKGRRRFLLLTLSLLTIVLPVCTVLYSVWIRHLPSAIDLTNTVQMIAYSTLGVFVLTLGVLTWVEMGSARDNTPSRLLGAGIAIYATALILWPAWLSSVLGDASSHGAALLLALGFLIGYLLVFLASVHQLESGAAQWASTIQPIQRRPSPWIDMAVSAAAVVTVLGSGLAAYRATPNSAARLFYIGVLFVSAAVMVARTMLLATNDNRLRSRLVTDRVTGAENPRGFESRIAEYVAAATRFGEGFVLVIVDLDGFGWLNESRGTDTGDFVLARIADELSSAHQDAAHVFRLAGDRFALLVSVDDAIHAAQSATRTRGLVRLADTGIAGLDCSVGYALCPDDAVSFEALMERAEKALAWAKSCGGGRVVRYEESIARPGFVDDEGCSRESDSRLELTRALSAAGDARDPAHASHSRNVATMVRLLAERLELTPEHIERVQIAGLLHDVGKIALQAHHGPTRLSSLAKRERQREHCALGARMVESLGIPGVSQWILCHHERWDGKGYPGGLSGEQIPVEARMIALANHYDARVSGAHYGAPMSKQAALQEIDFGMGTRFEPGLAEQFIEMISATEAFATSERRSTE
jgi:diguanylate cyclase (GGDEF)-like protein/putative nucleotidyltransferase with HDIG domain